MISSHVGHGVVEAEEVDVLASEQGHLGQRLTDGVEELTQALQEARLADVVRGLKVGNSLRCRTQPERIAIEGKWGLPPGWWDYQGDAKLLNEGPNGAKVAKRIGKLGQGRAQGRAIDAFLRFTHPRAAQEGGLSSCELEATTTSQPRVVALAFRSRGGTSSGQCAWLALLLRRLIIRLSLRSEGKIARPVAGAQQYSVKSAVGMKESNQGH